MGLAASGPLPGQEICGLDIHHADCDSVSAAVSVFFPFGAGGTCPALQEIAVAEEAQATVASLYYDVSGPRPQLGCTTSAEIGIPLVPGAAITRLRTYAIMDGDTLAAVSDTVVATCAVGIRDPGRRAPLAFRVQDGQIQWPTGGIPPSSMVRVASVTGAVLRTVAARAGRMPIHGLAPGLYVVGCPELAGSGTRAFVVGAD